MRIIAIAEVLLVEIVVGVQNKNGTVKFDKCDGYDKVVDHKYAFGVQDTILKPLIYYSIGLVQLEKYDESTIKKRK